MIRALALCALLALPAAAQELPALYDVTGVAAGDVLNVRQGPSAAEPVVATLPPGARGVEVVALSPEGGWGLVNAGEVAGWVSMRFMAAAGGPGWETLATPLTCLGTEPFWSARLGEPPGTMLLQTPDHPVAAMGIGWSAPVAGRMGMLGVSLASGTAGGFAVIRAESCSDGMSERHFGLAAEFFLDGLFPGETEPLGLSGCCTMAR